MNQIVEGYARATVVGTLLNKLYKVFKYLQIIDYLFKFVFFFYMDQ